MDYLILVLAIWRLTSLIVHEDGPSEMFARFRIAVGVQENEYGRFGTTEFAKMILCFWCASVWVAIGVYTLYLFLPIGFFVPFALSGAAILIDKIVG